MSFPPGTKPCQVCGHAPAWKDGRLSTDHLCDRCAEAYFVPRVFVMKERTGIDGVIIAVSETIDDLGRLQRLETGFHNARATLGGRVH